VQQITDDAYLQADLTPLAAKSPGHVRNVPVRDFQRVSAGDLLVEIVDDDYRAQLDRVQSSVDAAQARRRSPVLESPERSPLPAAIRGT
jgi:membrane fusion protein, multidrug efflux system